MDDRSSDDLNNWDPMRESFNDETFNAYDSGAGSRLPRHQQPANSELKMSQQTKLHLYPLPDGYTQESLHNIFLKYGEVKEVYVHHSNRWAFVTMKTLAAAEIAIRDMSNDPELKFKVKYAREKSDPVSVAASEAGSLSERKHRKNEDGSQFTDSSKQKSINNRGSMAEQCVTEPSERLPLNFQFSKTLLPVSGKKSNKQNKHKTSVTMNGDIVYQAVPNCCYCKCQTPNTCTKCRQPFCSIDCMIHGYNGHTSQCVHVPLLDIQSKSSNKIPSTYSQPMNDDSPQPELSNSCRNDLNYCKQPSVSRRSNCLNDLGAKCLENNSQDMYDGRPATTPNSRAFETNRNNEKPGHYTSYDGHKIVDAASINFNIAKEGKRNYGKERDERNRSNQGSEFSLNNEIQSSRYRSKMDNVSSKDRQSQISGNTSYAKENDLSRDNRSRLSGTGQNNDNDSLWETQSLVGYNSKKEMNLSKDNRFRVSRNNLNKEDESSWETQSLVSKSSTRKSKKSKKSKNSGKSAASPRPTYEVSFSPKKLDLSSLFRVDINENDKYKVKLAESGPPAVLIMKEIDSLNSMINILQEHSLKPMENISIRQKCAVKRTPDDYGTWYRGFIVEDNPLLVKFIDFSYERVAVRTDDVRVLPEKFASINPFCYPVKFMNASIDELNELKNVTFEIVFLSQTCYGTWNVDLVKKPCNEEVLDSGSIKDAGEQCDSYVAPKNSHRSRPDLKVVLKKDVPVEVYVTYIDTRFKKVYITIQDKLQKLLDLIGNISPPLPDLEEFRLNTMCFALYEKGWYRAKIVSVNPLEVYFVDFGNVEPIEKSDLKMLPDAFKNIDPLAIPVKFRTGSKSVVNVDDVVEIIPVEQTESEKIWIVREISEVSDNEDTVVEPNEEFANNSYAPKVALDEIMEVQVTHTVSNTEYYVGPKNMNDLSILDIDDEEVGKLGSLKAPLVGTLCVKMYESIWCRAEILKLEPLTIYYIDFGNGEEVNIEELYPLPEKLRTVPPVAFKIQLQEPKDLPEYEPLKIKKVTEQYWTVVSES